MAENTLPEEFADQMKSQLGDSWGKFQEALQLPPVVSVRINPKKNSRISGSNIPWCSAGRYLSERPVFTLDPHLHAGAYYVQEASSMFLEQALLQSVDLSQSLNVLDLCAAPGGKSTHVASLLNKTSLLVSNEVIRSRTSVLAENLQKWGYGNGVVTNNDPADFEQLESFFDVIILDAPCSGEGLFRKDPDALKQWSTEQVGLCMSRQRRILSDVWPSLKEGGILIYSTCTYNRSENEDNLQWLDREQSAEFISLQLGENWGVEKSMDGNVIGYRFFPHRVNGEGFFLSVIRKTAGNPGPKMKALNRFVSPSKKIVDQISEWVLHPDDKEFILRNNQLQFFPKNKATEIEWLAKHLRIVTAGTFMAEVKHEKLVPDHAMALSVELNKEQFETVDLDTLQALNYLRKEGISVQPERKGFSLVTCQENPLGWINVLDKRINNLYPPTWRIRMTG